VGDRRSRLTVTSCGINCHCYWTFFLIYIAISVSHDYLNFTATHRTSTTSTTATDATHTTATPGPTVSSLPLRQQKLRENNAGFRQGYVTGVCLIPRKLATSTSSAAVQLSKTQNSVQEILDSVDRLAQELDGLNTRLDNFLSESYFPRMTERPIPAVTAPVSTSTFPVVSGLGTTALASFLHS